MTNHLWVKLTMTTIEVEPQANGSLHTFVGQTAEEVAEEDSELGCAFCGMPLTTSSYDTKCMLEAAPQNN